LLAKASILKADAPEGESPKALATEPTVKPKTEELPEAALEDKKSPQQDEDNEDKSKEREYDIYADAVLACKCFHVIFKSTHSNNITGSIEDPESCIMCSG
jgi:ribonucleoside-diphosphate reductase subunit M1